ncbi:MAG: LamG domain-containing protein, partial [Cyanobacteria bacterium J06649_11]
DNTINDLTSNSNNGTLNNGDDTNFVDSEIPTFKGYVDIELNNKVTNQPGIILNYQIESDSTATQDEDFYNSQTDVSTTDGEPQTDSIFIAEGEDSARIYLTALPDAVVEGDENIKLTLLPDFNKALDLDGVDDNVDTNADIVDVTTADFTLEAWIKTTGTQEGIIVKTDGDTSWEKGEKAFYLNGSGQAYFVGFGNSYIRGTTAVNDGEWHHVAVVWDYSSGTSGTGKIYVDGEDDTASSAYNANNSDSDISNNHLRIGAPNYGEAPNYFSGEIDEVRIWDKARTQTEIQETLYATLSGSEDNLVAHYNFNDNFVDGNTINDSTVNINNGTLVADNQVLSLDGSGDYVEVGNPDELKFGTESFTVEAWVYDDPSSLTDFNNVVSKKAGAGTTSGWT